MRLVYNLTAKIQNTVQKEFAQRDTFLIPNKNKTYNYTKLYISFEGVSIEKCWCENLKWVCLWHLQRNQEKGLSKKIQLL